jgi:hypothetical protein
MTKDKFKCPHVECDYKSGRNWNVERHIRAVHKCECCPAEKSSNISKHLPLKDIQEAQNISSTADLFHTKGPNPYISSWNRRPFNAHDHNKSKNTAKEENEGPGHLDDKTDPVDMLYAIYKKAKRRNDKMFEMINYFNEHPPDPRFPFFPPSDVQGYSEINNILASGVSNYPSHVLPEHQSHPQPTPKQEKVIGYEVYNCGVCLESESLPVIDDQYSLSRKEHICDPQKASTVRTYPRFFREEFAFNNVLSSDDKIIKTTKEWTQGRVFLVSSKVSPEETPMNPITIDWETKGSQYGWLTRAIEDRHTILNEQELKEFIRLTDSATFCCITVSFLKDYPQNTRQESYYLFLNHKPCVPFEN